MMEIMNVIIKIIDITESYVKSTCHVLTVLLRSVNNSYIPLRAPFRDSTRIQLPVPTGKCQIKTAKEGKKMNKTVVIYFWLICIVT